MDGNRRRRTVEIGNDDRGVSEVLGFVLTFAVIVTSTGLVFTYGYGSLEGFRDSQQNDNAEQAFVRIATKLQQVGDDGAPLRAGDLSVAPGQLSVREDTELTVTVDGANVPSAPRSRTFTAGSLRYSLDDTTIAYESNAIFRNDGGDVAMLAPPSMACRPGRTVLSITSLNATDATTIASDSVTVVGRYQDTSLWFPFARMGPGNASSVDFVSVTVDSRNSEGWNRYLLSNGWVVTGPDTYTCTTDELYVRQVNATVRLV